MTPYIYFIVHVLCTVHLISLFRQCMYVNVRECLSWCCCVGTVLSLPGSVVVMRHDLGTTSKGASYCLWSTSFCVCMFVMFGCDALGLGFLPFFPQLTFVLAIAIHLDGGYTACKCEGGTSQLVLVQALQLLPLSYILCPASGCGWSWYEA